MAGENEGTDVLDFLSGDVEEVIDDAIVEEEETETESAAEDSEEEVSEEDAAEEETSDDEPLDEVTQLREELAAMREALAVATGKKQDKKVDEPPEPREVEVEELNFLDGIEVEDLTEDPKAFNAILNKVMKEGVRIGREAVLRDIPNIVSYNIRQQAVLKEATDTFYTENKDLVPFKKVVGTVAEEILSEDPSLSLQDLFTKAAKETRKRLALVKAASKGEEKPPRKPATPPNTKGGRRPAAKPQLNEQQKEVLDLIEGV